MSKAAYAQESLFRAGSSRETEFITIVAGAWWQASRHDAETAAETSQTENRVQWGWQESFLKLQSQLHTSSNKATSKFFHSPTNQGPRVTHWTEGHFHPYHSDSEHLHMCGAYELM